MRKSAWSAAFAALLLAGCVSPKVAVEPAAVSPASEGASVVVALPDGGVNPYHIAFRAPGIVLPPQLAAAHPEIVDLTFGPSYDDNVRADSAFWEHVELGKLYWFRGTRVLAIATSDPALESPIRDSNGHGSLTAATILKEDPGAFLISIDISSQNYFPQHPFGFDPQYVARGIAWAASQPFVDVVSISLGAPAAAPVPGFEGIPNSTRAGVAGGKVVIVATGNDALPSIWDQIAGPPWVVRAGGADPSQHGETVMASKAPDYVSNYTARGPCWDSVTALCTDVGTSFSAPLVAGSFARVVRELREVAGHSGGIRGGALVDAGGLRVTNADLRAAFNATAAYWDVTEYSPQVPASDNAPNPLVNAVIIAGQASTPILPAPWVQMGWGYVGGGSWKNVTAAIVAHKLPAKDALAAQYMAEQQALREAYWGSSGLRG